MYKGRYDGKCEYSSIKVRRYDGPVRNTVGIGIIGEGVRGIGYL